MTQLGKRQPTTSGRRSPAPWEDGERSERNVSPERAAQRRAAARVSLRLRRLDIGTVGDCRRQSTRRGWEKQKGKTTCQWSGPVVIILVDDNSTGQPASQNRLDKSCPNNDGCKKEFREALFFVSLFPMSCLTVVYLQSPA
jgi:hypothetical protein